MEMFFFVAMYRVHRALKDVKRGTNVCVRARARARVCAWVGDQASSGGIAPTIGPSLT